MTIVEISLLIALVLVVTISSYMVTRLNMDIHNLKGSNSDLKKSRDRYTTLYNKEVEEHIKTISELQKTSDELVNITEKLTIKTKKYEEQKAELVNTKRMLSKTGKYYSKALSLIFDRKQS